MDPRYSRLERYAPLAAALPRWQQASCAVVGLGGLGGGLVQHLARFGVWRLILIDRDVVAEENLGHQTLFTEQHARDALPKAIAAAEIARAVNSAVEVIPHVAELTRQNISELLGAEAGGTGGPACPDGKDRHSGPSHPQLIFDGLDNYYTRLLLNDCSRANAVPYFYAGVVRGELSARAVIPGATGCLRCLMDAPPAVGEAPTCASEGVFPPLLGVANALQLDAASRYLAGTFNSDDDVLYSLSLPGWDLHATPLHGPRMDCPACQGRYEYLDGTLDWLAESAHCAGRIEVQLGAIDLARAAEWLAASGDWTLRANDYCVVAANTESCYTLFPDGRVVQEPGEDPAELRRFVAMYLGA